MTRYRSRSQPQIGFRQSRMDWIDDDRPLLLHHLTVSDHEAVWTGLLDQNGDELWREPEPMGFHNPREH